MPDFLHAVNQIFSPYAADVRDENVSVGDWVDVWNSDVASFGIPVMPVVSAGSECRFGMQFVSAGCEYRF